MAGGVGGHADRLSHVRLDLVDGLAQGRVIEDLDVARPIGDEEGVPRGIPAEPGRSRAPRELAGDLEGLSKSIAGGEEVEMKLFKSAIEQDRLRSRLCYEGFDSNLDIDK